MKAQLIMYFKMGTEKNIIVLHCRLECGKLSSEAKLYLERGNQTDCSSCLFFDKNCGIVSVLPKQKLSPLIKMENIVMGIDNE